MPSPGPESVSGISVMFRPAKKRKIYRHRSEDDDDNAHKLDPSTPTAATLDVLADPAADPAADPEDESGYSVVEALRLRNAKKHRAGGVAFRAGPSSSSHPTDADGNAEQSMVLHEGGGEGVRHEDSVILGGIDRRFAPQTGLVGELVNKHMEEYVESELARRKRRAAEAALAQGGEADADASQLEGEPPLITRRASGPLVPQGESQRVLQGKLLEIDLGEEARAKNVEMTERARRRLQRLGADPEEDAAGSTRQRKPRLGPDGKPWRGRNRRGSEDIKRDRLVEEFLSENRLGVYDVQPEQPSALLGVGDDEMAADDRIAEEFRREFMDAVSQRRRRKAAPASTKPGARKDEEILKGPKLGGSRNARAAMRDLLLKEQEMKKRR